MACKEIEFGIFPSIRSLIAGLTAINRFIEIFGTSVEAIINIRDILLPWVKRKLMIKKFQDLIADFQMPIPIEVLTRAEVGEIGGGYRRSRVTDLDTGIYFYIYWRPSAATHIDWSPATPADVRRIQEILRPGEVYEVNWRDTSRDGPWSWGARPAMLEVDGRRIAVGIHLMPHCVVIGPDSNPGPLLNPREGGIGGHMCMYFGIDSYGATNNPPWRHTMNEAAREAERIVNDRDDEIMRQYERLNNILDALIEWNPGN